MGTNFKRGDIVPKNLQPGEPFFKGDENKLFIGALNQNQDAIEISSGTANNGDSVESTSITLNDTKFTTLNGTFSTTKDSNFSEFIELKLYEITDPEGDVTASTTTSYSVISTTSSISTYNSSTYTNANTNTINVVNVFTNNKNIKEFDILTSIDGQTFKSNIIMIPLNQSNNITIIYKYDSYINNEIFGSKVNHPISDIFNQNNYICGHDITNNDEKEHIGFNFVYRNEKLYLAIGYIKRANALKTRSNTKYSLNIIEKELGATNNTEFNTILP